MFQTTFIINCGVNGKEKREEVVLSLPPEVGKIYYHNNKTLTVTGIKEELVSEQYSDSSGGYMVAVLKERKIAKIIVFVNERELTYMVPEDK